MVDSKPGNCINTKDPIFFLNISLLKMYFSFKSIHHIILQSILNCYVLSFFLKMFHHNSQFKMLKYNIPRKQI